MQFPKAAVKSAVLALMLGLLTAAAPAEAAVQTFAAQAEHQRTADESKLTAQESHCLCGHHEGQAAR